MGQGRPALVIWGGFQYNRQRVTAYFLVLGAWLLVDRIYPDAGAFAGGWGIAFRVLTAAVLVVLAVVFVKEYRKNRKSARGQEAKELPAQEKDDTDDPEGLF